MKRRILYLLVGILLFGGASAAQATGWGFGGFGGVTVPVVQDDAANGVVFGAHLRLSLGGLLGIEPNVMYCKDGDYDFEDAPGETFEGSKLTAVGVNVILGGAGPVTGFRFFPFAGANLFNLKNDARDFSDSRLGWNVGMGFEIGAGSLGIEGRAVGAILPLDGGGSRKWVHLRAGINYYFGIR